MPRRREVLKALGGLLAAGLGPAEAGQPFVLFVPSGPGGGWDQAARALEQAIRGGAILPNIQVEYAPGNGGATGLTRFLQRAGQGETLMIAGQSLVGALVAARQTARLSEATPIARLNGEPLAVLVPAASPFKAMPALMSAFSNDPAKIVFGGSVHGATDHILAGMIARAAKVDPRRMAFLASGVPVGGAIAALNGNLASCAITNIAEAVEGIKGGRVRALAVSAARRMSGIDAPTLRDAGLDVELYNWRGVFGPPGISMAQKTFLSSVVERAIAGESWRQSIASGEWSDIFLGGDEFAAFVMAEETRIGGVMRDLGLA